MKRLSVVLGLVFCSVFAIQDDCNAQSTKELRILSYNIHHGEGVDAKLDLGRIAKVIKSASPDIVSLQEVDRNIARSGNVDQPAELARLVEMHSVFKKNIEVEGGEYGNAVLTKLDVIESRNERLPMTDNGEVRGVLIVHLKLEGQSIPLTMMSTHFDHRPKPEDRIASANKIIELANGLNGPLILAGDLNATPDTEPVKILLKQWTNASHEIMPTFPAYLPLLQIDYILLNSTPPSGYSWKVIETKVIDDQVASDHRPILSVVQLSGP